MSFKIVASESGDCDCGDRHDEGDALWSGFITKRAAEAELSIQRNSHSLNLEVRSES